MRKMITSICLALTLLMAACKITPDSKAIRQEVLNIHDKLMVSGEKIIKNRMRLDTLLLSERIKSAPDSSRQHIKTLIDSLNQADESMMDWMHFFKDDYKGKNEQQDLEYYRDQMIKIRAVEDQYIKLTRESDSLLKVYQIKTDQ